MKQARSRKVQVRSSAIRREKDFQQLVYSIIFFHICSDSRCCLVRNPAVCSSRKTSMLSPRARETFDNGPPPRFLSSNRVGSCGVLPQKDANVPRTLWHLLKSQISHALFARKPTVCAMLSARVRSIAVSNVSKPTVRLIRLSVGRDQYDFRGPK
jgi:hypothetical protein